MILSFLQFLREMLKRLASVFFSGKHFQFSITLLSHTSDFAHQPDYKFKTNDGFSIPILPFYRYSIKKGWAYFPEINSLEHLKNLGRLDAVQLDFLEEAKGTRTLGRPMPEIRNVLFEASQKNQDAFFDFNLGNPADLLIKQSDKEIAARISNYRKQYSNLFKNLTNLGIMNNVQGANLLEVGFISGGYSLFGFEQMGFKVSGVDNGYNGMSETQRLPEIIKQKVHSRVNFRFGDLTKTTPFPARSFDIIYSASVLEHIKNIDEALEEMNRLLKPGGIMIHNYHPYFCHDGGHALGIGDFPWAHVMCSEDDYCNYISSQRTYESELAIPWLTGALNRELTLDKLKRQLILGGNQILIWQTKSSHQNYLRQLSPDTMERCLQTNPNISLDDLLTQTVSFVAKKR